MHNSVSFNQTNHSINSPQIFPAYLNAFDQWIRVTLAAVRVNNEQASSQNKPPSEIIHSLIGRYRIVRSLPYFAALWSEEENADQTLLATQMQAWLNSDVIIVGHFIIKVYLLPSPSFFFCTLFAISLRCFHLVLRLQTLFLPLLSSRPGC